MSWQRGKAYAQDLRDRVLAATGRLREVAERFGVSLAYVSRVRSRHGRLHQACADAQHNHVPLRLAGLNEPLLAQIAMAPEQTLAQLCQWVRAEHGIEVGPTTMGKTLIRFGLTRKKRRFMLPRLSGICALRPLAHHDVCLRAEQRRPASATGAGRHESTAMPLWLGWSSSLCLSCGQVTSW